MKTHDQLEQRTERFVGAKFSALAKAYVFLGIVVALTAGFVAGAVLF